MKLKKFPIEVRTGEPHSVIAAKADNGIEKKRCYAPIDRMKEYIPIENKYVPTSSFDICMDTTSPSNMNEDQSISVPKANTINSAGRSDQKELDIDNAVKYLLSNFHFISCAGRKLYFFNDRYFEDTQNVTKATKIIKDCLNEDNNRLTSGYREIYQQLLTEKEIWYDNLEQLETREDRIVFLNGTFSVSENYFYENQFFPEDYMLSSLDISYDPNPSYENVVVNNFINRFCGGDERKEQLLFEITGFCLSNYRNTKACFYFMGVPNAGKSVLCRWIELAVGKDAYISIPIKDLTGHFNSGELENKKVCADEDVAIEAALSTRDLSMIKKISSSDTIQTNGKYKQQGYIRPNAKLLWAGNGMMRFQTNEDLTPFAERLIIFPLDNPIPEDERDPFIIDKLMNERDYIIQRSLEALHNLANNQFRFSTVVDSKDYFSCQNIEDGIAAFVNQYCILQEDEEVAIADLYEVYERFCKESIDHKKVAINVFSNRLKVLYDITEHRTKSKRCLKGIRLR